MDPKTRLGRGLDSLLGGLDNAPAGPTTSVAVARVQPNPYQPRKTFDEDELRQLADSIKAHGVLQPLAVRKVGDDYQLIAGERRLRASQLAGLAEVPVHVVAFDDQQVFEASLVENIQRADLNPIEKAMGFKDYLEKFGLTQDQLSARIGIDRTSISNLINLLHLPHEVQSAIRNDQISLGHAKVLKGLGDPDMQIRLCKEVMLKGLSVKGLEALAKQAKAEAEAPQKAETPASAKFEKTPHVAGIEDELRQRFAVKVSIQLKAKEKGQIVIGFDTNDDFERVMELLRR